MPTEQKANDSGEILALAYRPRKLSSLFGQGAMVSAIRKQVASRTPPAFLFHGGTGCGKTTVARILAVSFQCEHHPPEKWGDPCDECWSKWDEFAIHEINASETSGVEEIGNIAQLSRYRPTPPSKKRVIIMDEAQLMTRNAQNLLLKYFEPEKSKYIVWVICTTEPPKILPTLRRRCMIYQVKALSFDSKERFVKAMAKRAGIAVTSAFIDKLHEAQIGSPALVLMALEKFASGMPLEECVSGIDGSGADSLQICKAVTSGNWSTLKGHLGKATADDARWIRASVLGWLRGFLARSSNPKERKVIADSLVELSGFAPMEDSLLSHWLWGTLHHICSRFSAGV